MKTFASAAFFAASRFARSRAAASPSPCAVDDGGQDEGQEAEDGRHPAHGHDFPLSASSRAARVAISLASGALGASRA